MPGHSLSACSFCAEITIFFKLVIVNIYVAQPVALAKATFSSVISRLLKTLSRQPAPVIAYSLGG